MMKSMSTKVLSVIAVGALLLTGCDRDEEKAAAGVPAESADILKYIPADSPYVFASLAPLPDDIMDEIEPKLDNVLVAYQAVLREVVAQQSQSETDTRSDEEKAQVEAFVDELAGLLSMDGLRDAGIARDSLGAFYGNGLLPVARFELSDSDSFEATLARLEERAGSEMPTAEVDGQSYRYFDAEEFRVVIAVTGDQAVFTFVPAAFSEEQTGRALGLTLPDDNIGESGVLEELIGKYGFDNYMVGFVDLPKLAERFVGQPTGLDTELFGLIGYDSSQVSDVCKVEIREMAGVMSRMVIGYTNITAKQFDSNLVFELRDDLAKGMQALPAAVPGLGVSTDALMSFGMSIDAKAAREFLEARFDAIEADPFECEHFSDIQAGVASGRQSLNQPVPPMVYDFKGFLAVIDDIEGLDVGTQTPPTSVDGTFLLAMDNAQALIAMGAMFSPELAALDLQPDGNPVALELPQLQAMGMEAFAALNEGAVAISVGGNAESEVASMLEADAVSPPPFMSFSMDAARYYSFMGEAIAAGDADDAKAATPEMKEAMTDMMQSIADLYDRMSGDVVFTENGIELRMVEVLKD
ncbi:MAG: hypothetical protein QNJ23_08455 [Woeseiaceae bacterium]|nr:hypothetical protein [Woeseiaceae bacterium]